ncbi:MAG: 1-(5-phosphoribosyl)-5-[(5-phosphoribosylamino)methylideneamino]imidazole-4-carboxamide isomerase [Syntrophus sp. (in: bacteria)]|nr:1-(5-phosphoribosyl)-5-[(5-phosphoribosylamino)methylideneamino]imidazole-4-carboxamide isomerase [Syntrophus sp. (in: bacteria)]
MIVIPAIDLKDGRCVRLIQGDFGRATIYADDPVEMASIWKSKGAERLHVVDLDGSLAGIPRHEAVIRDIVTQTGLPLQVGGGIREMRTVEAYLGMGVRWVILGTAALRDPEFVRNACREFPDRVILGIDARGSQLAVQGWTEMQAETSVALARRFEDARPAALVYTDIMRDGMETGVNIESTRELAESVEIPLIASGGVSGMRDIENLMNIEGREIFGVIAGKALYTGALCLADAIAFAKSRRKGGYVPEQEIGAGNA